MDHRIPKAAVTITVICAVLAAISFIFLNEAFKGPSVTDLVVGEGFELEATFEDTEILPTKQPVLLRGVTIGTVSDVEFHKEESNATVAFSIGEEYRPIYRDATVAVGERTILGDPYVRLTQGSEAAGVAESGDALKAIDSVDFDEALDFLDLKGRDHVKSLIGELEDATRDDEGAQHLNETVGGLTRTISELSILTDTLEGQEENLAGLVKDSAIVLDELGSREVALSAIVSSGRTALDALAANAEALDAGLAEVPGVLRSATSVLAASRPLLAQARPLIADLRAAAPHLSAVLADLPAVLGDTVDVVSGLSGVPTMRELLRVVRSVGPSVPGIEAAARNLVPLLVYAADRADGLGAFFANMRGVGQSRDSIGHWLRTAVVLDPNLGADIPAPDGCAAPTVCFNAFPEPHDGLDPQPFEPGSYPRLEPFDPPPPP